MHLLAASMHLHLCQVTGMMAAAPHRGGCTCIRCRFDWRPRTLGWFASSATCRTSLQCYSVQGCAWNSKRSPCCSSARLPKLPHPDSTMQTLRCPPTPPATKANILSLYHNCKGCWPTGLRHLPLGLLLATSEKVS